MPNSFQIACRHVSPRANVASTLSWLVADDRLVYFEPVVANHYPDFVVIVPSLGVLTIELKGWKSEDIVGAGSKAVLLREPSRVGEVSSTGRCIAPLREKDARCRAGIGTWSVNRLRCRLPGPRRARWCDGFDQMLNGMPLPRPTGPRGLIAFPASEDARFVNGVILPVDGRLGAAASKLLHPTGV